MPWLLLLPYLGSKNPQMWRCGQPCLNLDLNQQVFKSGVSMMATLTAVRQHSSERISFPRITRPSISAGTTVFLAYIFVGLTVQVGVLTQIGGSALRRPAAGFSSPG